MTDQNQSLVDPDSQINPGDYVQNPHDAMAKSDGSLEGYAGAAASMAFTEGVGHEHDDYDDPATNQEVKGTGWLTGLPAADDAHAYVKSLQDSKKDVWDRIERGQFPDPGALLDLIVSGAGVAADMLGAADPIGMLLQYEISWLIDHFRPFRLMIDGLTGIPEVISGYSTTWGNIENFLDTIRADFQQTYQSGPGQWSGPAHDRYLGMAATVGAALDASATSAKGMSTLIKAVGDLVTGVRQLIITLISSIPAEILDTGEMLLGDDEQGAAGTASRVAEVADDGAKLIKELLDVLATISTIAGPIAMIVTAINSAVKDFGA